MKFRQITEKNLQITRVFLQLAASTFMSFDEFILECIPIAGHKSHSDFRLAPILLYKLVSQYVNIDCQINFVHN